MNDNIEDWNAHDWAQHLLQREKMVGYYFSLLNRYYSLPGCEQMIEHDMIAHFGEDKYELMQQMLMPPIAHILHSWDKREGDPAFGETYDPVAEENALATASDSGPAVVCVANMCVSSMASLVETWSRFLAGKCPQEQAIQGVTVLDMIAQIDFYLLAANDSIYLHEKEKAKALLSMAGTNVEKLKTILYASFDPKDLPKEIAETIGGLPELFSQYFLNVVAMKFKDYGENDLPF